MYSRNDGKGYGFNMQAQRGKTGQFIGKVDAGSPADQAGLRDGDRIIEVNSSNIETDTHKQVVDKIKAVSGKVTLLVVDQAADDYFRNNNVTVSSQMSALEKLSSPEVAQPAAGIDMPNACSFKDVAFFEARRY